MIHCETKNMLGKFVSSIMCDVCKKTYQPDDWEEVQEFHHINFIGGYGSVFGDCNEVKCDICQHCLKRIIEKWVQV